jgi:MFS family permease
MDITSTGPAGAEAGPGRRWRRPGPVDRILLAHGLSSFCWGMVFPYTAIYLDSRPGIGVGGVVAYYTVSGAASLTVALLLAAGWISLPRVTLSVAGNGLWLAGYLALAMAGSYPVVIAAAAAVGAGQGCFLAAVIPILNGLLREEERRRVFARRYAILNGTLAGGSLLAGALLLVLPRSVLPWFFVVNALGIIPVALAVLASRGHEITPAAAPQRPGAPAGQAGARAPAPGRTATLALVRLALPVVIFQLAVYLLGFSQFEATMPLVARKLLHLPLFSVSVMLVVNVVVIAVCQRPVTRLLERRPEITGLRAGVACWVAAFTTLGLLSLAPPGFRLGGLVAFSLLFGLGECAYSCSFYPWLIATVPDADLPRANALANSMMGIGTFVGPSFGVSLILTGSALAVTFSLAACCAAVLAAAGLAARRSRRRAAGVLAAPVQPRPGAGSPGEHPPVSVSGPPAAPPAAG